MSARRFLFLQGLAGPMFARLGDQLRAEGHAVQRVNFCGGDALAWAGRPAADWRGSQADWPAQLAAWLREWNTTDLMLFGAQRPLHRAAIAPARALGVRIHVFEEGLVRPNFISLERLGARDEPWLPRDPRWYREVDRHLPRHDQDRPIRVPLALRAAQEITHHLANAIDPLAYPGYRSHRQHVAAREAIGFTRRLGATPWHTHADARRLAALQAGGAPYFVLPLQLDGDAQIVHHSTFADIAAVIELVLHSFAAHAPGDARLVIKNHPLDPGLHGHGRTVRRLVRDLDLGARVLYVETGHLPTLLDGASGAVVVNSTVGLSALSQGCPTKALARPVYDMPGLTSRIPLDHFWHEPEPPDAALFQAVRNTVIHASQVNGDFCTRQGIALAIDGCRRMLGERSPLEELLALHGWPDDEAVGHAEPIVAPQSRPEFAWRNRIDNDTQAV